jgi:hypothetical protein
MGAEGLLQGDSRFGDIRIGMATLSDNQLALSLPFDWAGGTAGGDIILNDQFFFNRGGTNGAYDLNAVLLHEAGHALGLPHSTAAGSPMKACYQGPLEGLTLTDVQELDKLYGPRLSDSFDKNKGNHSLKNAESIKLYDGDRTIKDEVLNGDITKLEEQDYFKFSSSENPGPVTVWVRTSGYSLLTTRLTLYDENQEVIGIASANDPRNGDLPFHLEGLNPKKTYFIKVEGNPKDVFTIGSYQVMVVPDSFALKSLPQSPVFALTNGFLNLDKNEPGNFGTDANVPGKFAGIDVQFDYSYTGSLSDKNDVDFFMVKVPPSSSKEDLIVLTAVVWSVESGKLDPKLTVYDAHQNQVTFNLLDHDGNSYVVQIPDAKPKDKYFFNVQAYDPEGPNATGKYVIGIDFGTQATQLETAVAATLTNSQKDGATTLSVARTSWFHFLFSAGQVNSLVETAVRMTIFDESGIAVVSLVVGAGQAFRADILLGEGTYLVYFAAGTRTGEAMADLDIDLKYLVQNDSIDPYYIDPGTGSSGGSVSWSPFSGTVYGTVPVQYANPYWH